MSILSTGDEYLRIAGAVEENLQRHVLAQWFPRAVDASGGFHQNYGEDWERLPQADRSIVYQARLTWLAAQAALQYPAQSAVYLSHARHGLDCLVHSLWDLEFGGFFWSVDEAGQPERGGEKYVYGLSFAIYSLAALHKASRHEAAGDDAALDLAKQAYFWLQTHAHDTVNGGWQEALSRQASPLSSPAGQKARDAVGTPFGSKSMNTHIHLLESLTALYEVWPDPAVRESLVEVFGIIRDKVAVESVGCLNLYFTSDWHALPDHESFGHDVETAFLLIEAISALGQPDDLRTWTLARRIVDHALDYGWDTDHGGFYDAGTAFGQAFGREKIWWVQAEGLNALLLLHGRFGSETSRYWLAFLQQWEFIQTYQVDRKHGGWLPEVSAEGVPKPNRVKSDRWTECYHQGRALLTVSAALKRLAGESQASDAGGAGVGAGGGA